MAIKAIGWLEEKTFYREGSGRVESRSEGLSLAHVTYRRIFGYNGMVGLIDKGISTQLFQERYGFSLNAKTVSLSELDVKNFLGLSHLGIFSLSFLPVKSEEGNLPFGLNILTGEEAGRVDTYLKPILTRREADRYPEWGLVVRVNRPYQDGDYSHQKLPTPDQMSETTFEEMLRLGQIGGMDLPDNIWSIYTEACLEFLHREVVMQAHPTAYFTESEATRRVRKMIQQAELGRQFVKELCGGEFDDNVVPIPRIITDGKINPEWTHFRCSDEKIEAKRLKEVGDLILILNYGNCAI